MACRPPPVQGSSLCREARSRVSGGWGLPAGPPNTGPRDHWREHLPLLLHPQLVLSPVLISQSERERPEHGPGGSRLSPAQIGEGCEANSRLALTKSTPPSLSASQRLPAAWLTLQSKRPISPLSDAAAQTRSLRATHELLLFWDDPPPANCRDSNRKEDPSYD